MQYVVSCHYFYNYLGEEDMLIAVLEHCVLAVMWLLVSCVTSLWCHVLVSGL